MPKIRSVKPTFFEDEDIARLGSDARLIYIALWTLADDEGRLAYDPRNVHRYVYGAAAAEAPVDAVGVDGLIKSLDGIGRVVGYTADEKLYLVVPRLRAHQRMRSARRSELPAPPAELLEHAAGLRRASFDRLFAAQPSLSTMESSEVESGKLLLDSPTAAPAEKVAHDTQECQVVQPDTRVCHLSPGRGRGGGRGSGKGKTSAPRARGNDPSSPDEPFDFEDDLVTGLPGVVKQELHMRLGKLLKGRFGTCRGWNGGVADRWLSDLGAAVHARDATIDELEAWLVKDDTRPDVADMSDPMKWLRRMFARRGAQHRKGRRRKPASKPKGGRMEL